METKLQNIEHISSQAISLSEAKKKKHKDCSSITYTTGDPLLNIKHFNKRMGTDFSNPSTEEAKAQKAAEKAAKEIGTIAAATPDGANALFSNASDAGSAAASTSGDSGGSAGVSEELELNEETVYVAKYNADFELPDNIHIVDKNKIEAELEKLEPEEEFEVGYITPVYFYAELWDKFTLLKCTQLTGYTGVDYIEARANDDANRERRIQISKDAIALGNKNGVHLDYQPNAHREGDFSANYASTNKTVLQDHGNTLLFYPKVGSTPKVTYYLDLHNGMGYLPVRREQLERTILNYVKDIATELETGLKKDGTPRKRRWDDATLAAKIRRQLDIDAATIAAVTMDQEDKFETRSKINNGAGVAKPQVRALYTNQIYYLDTVYGTLGNKLMENLLHESKRYVRRYYIRPQNIFCSNKTDVLQTLIQFEDQNCSVYTLNNLGDVKDVTKLTNNDIIYYYDDGILYDKNHVRIMDYDLYIKHEEERKKINPETVSDKVFNDVYSDRLIDNSNSTDEAFNLCFNDINAYGEILVEGKEVDGTCVICGEQIDGYGNNAEPYATGRCCDACNLKFVIPARMEQLNAQNTIEKE